MLKIMSMRGTAAVGSRHWDSRQRIHCESVAYDCVQSSGYEGSSGVVMIPRRMAPGIYMFLWTHLHSNGPPVLPIWSAPTRYLPPHPLLCTPSYATDSQQYPLSAVPIPVAEQQQLSTPTFTHIGTHIHCDARVTVNGV